MNRQRLLTLIAALAPTAVLAAAATVPVKLIEGLPEVCLFQRIWGIRCFGCGLTRATVLAAHGDFRQAMSLNPLVSVAYPLLIAAAVWGLWQALRRAAGRSRPASAG